MKRLHRRRQGGFTLLELLVTLLISVFGLMAILGLHISLTRGTETNTRVQEAVTVGGQIMERLRAKRPDALAQEVTGSATTSAPYTNATYTTVLGRNGVSYGAGVSVTPFGSSLLRLRVEISWADDTTGETRMLPLELLRTAREAL